MLETQQATNVPDHNMQMDTNNRCDIDGTTQQSAFDGCVTCGCGRTLDRRMVSSNDSSLYSSGEDDDDDDKSGSVRSLFDAVILADVVGTTDNDVELLLYRSTISRAGMVSTGNAKAIVMAKHNRPANNNGSFGSKFNNMLP
jgi:hypothetical protein